ncbi:hypothetical protein [Pelagibius sp. 7325]|uniref:hypothetical protein n=1 Tax=Pelagibius sp. 7325 TaxID=3131994 RepID=UPI0030EEDCE6
MRSRKALTACAVGALAMVFSVQQGEHGPLVVYKLAVPQPAAPGVSAPPTMPATVIIEAPDSAVQNGRRLAPPQPSVPDTVVMPAGQVLLPDAPPAHAATFGGIPVQIPAASSPEAPDSATAYLSAEEGDDSGRMINAQTGAPLTLKQVNDAVAWRRETAEKLRQVPIAPRF